MSLLLDGPPTRLDVRPLLAAGEEPFTVIMDAAGALPEGGVLELVAPFEPVPLYGVLGPRGFAHVAVERGPGEWVVRFTQTGITPEATLGDVFARHPATGPVLARHGLDLCCGGGKTLAFAAEAHGVPAARLLAELQAAALTA